MRNCSANYISTDEKKGKLFKETVNSNFGALFRHLKVLHVEAQILWGKNIFLKFMI